MSHRFPLIALAAALALGSPARADVVINEILYHAPNELEDLQFIELYNTGVKSVDLGGWKFTKGIAYTFPAKLSIESGGYAVVCKNQKEFRKHYGFEAVGEFQGALSHRGAAVELQDAAGKAIDALTYRSRAPWPLAADGQASSLERICPAGPSNAAENWAPSPAHQYIVKPGGTPGKQNANHSDRPLPIVEKVVFQPDSVGPNQPVKVEATIRATGAPGEVQLLYRVAGPGSEKPEQAVTMTPGSTGRYSATIPGQAAGQIVRFRIRAIDERGGTRLHPNPNEVRPALSYYVADKLDLGKISLGFIINVNEADFRAAKGESGLGFRLRFSPATSVALPARGRSAYVHVDVKTGRPKLYDFVNVTPRTAGIKVRFNKDQPLGDMTTINLIYEYMDRFVLAEPMAFEVYRKAGNAAPRTDFVRTWIDGRPLGYQLLIEQPNKSFLRHLGFNPEGNLYKIVWFGNGVVGQHEKKTHTHEGHDDVVDLVNRLNRTKGDEQWELIRKNFDVEQVINYFAVNMVLSHWDGYFNNYLTYHDTKGSGKWTMYPWDQDKTWGFHDGLRHDQVFFDMPITFGMAGDAPPGQGGRQAFFGGGAPWWRPGGHFSSQLLANPTFRRHFLARTKEILDKVYTEEAIFPMIQALDERLSDEVRIRAEARREDPKRAVDLFHLNLDLLRQHLKKRREYLLAQPDIKQAAAFDRRELK